MKQTVDHWILPALLSVLAAALLASPAEARWGPRCLAPNGIDDTDALQSALDGCSGGPHGCTVRLCAGLFRTAPLRVGDFRGLLRGAGRERTLIRALSNLAVNPNPNGYWMDDPLDRDLLPWPYLVQFIGGHGTVRDLSIEVPTPGEGQRPTQGWTEIAGVSHELAGAILVTGREPVRFAIQRVGVFAGKDPANFFFETTLLAGVAIRGLLFDPLGDPLGFPVLPVGGRHTVSDSTFVGMLSGVVLGELGDAIVTVRRSETRAFLAVDLLDASGSRVRVQHNEWDVASLGFNAFLNLDGEASSNNTFFIHNNRGRVGGDSGFGQGILFVDPGVEAEPGNSRVTVSGNDLAVGSTEKPGFVGIDIVGAGRLLLAWNTLRGGVAGDGAAGIGIDETTRCLALFNDVRRLETGPAPDLHLGGATSRCLAVVRRADVVQDDGTDNHVIRLR